MMYRHERSLMMLAVKMVMEDKPGGLTFEEDKLVLAVLIDRIDFGWQTPPEYTDEHRVPRNHRVIPHPPEPVVLHTGQNTQLGEQLSNRFCGKKQNKVLLLKDVLNSLLPPCDQMSNSKGSGGRFWLILQPFEGTFLKETNSNQNVLHQIPTSF